MKKLDPHTVFGSFERFNRVLYGGHEHDDDQGRFFTFAGDTPVFMGASSDYTRDTWCYQAKNGVLMSGLATTPGYALGETHDSFSSWFHDSSMVSATPIQILTWGPQIPYDGALPTSPISPRLHPLASSGPVLWPPLACRDTPWELCHFCPFCIVCSSPGFSDA